MSLNSPQQAQTRLKILSILLRIRKILSNQKFKQSPIMSKKKTLLAILEQVNSRIKIIRLQLMLQRQIGPALMSRPATKKILTAHLLPRSCCRVLLP